MISSWEIVVVFVGRRVEIEGFVLALESVLVIESSWTPACLSVVEAVKSFSQAPPVSMRGSWDEAKESRRGPGKEDIGGRRIGVTVE